MTFIYSMRSVEGLVSGMIQQLSPHPGLQVHFTFLFHHLQSVGFYARASCLMVTRWLPLSQISWPHTIMPVGRKQGEGQGGKIGLSSWVSFFPQRIKMFPKILSRLPHILLVITGLHGPALAAREAEKWVLLIFKLYSGMGAKKKGVTVALVTSSVSHSD